VSWLVSGTACGNEVILDRRPIGLLVFSWKMVEEGIFVFVYDLYLCVFVSVTCYWSFSVLFALPSLS